MDKNEKSGSTVKAKCNRRLQDAIKSKNPTRNMNYDRRLKDNERRSMQYYPHEGLPRRLTIDRRLTIKDRRINIEQLQ